MISGNNCLKKEVHFSNIARPINNYKRCTVAYIVAVHLSRLLARPCFIASLELNTAVGYFFQILFRIVFPEFELVGLRYKILLFLATGDCS